VKAPTGAWAGPFRSTYGVHVVRVWERQEGSEPVLASVHERVERDWRLERRRAIDQESRAQRRKRYVIRVEGAKS
jgi:hypothetical protein